MNLSRISIHVYWTTCWADFWKKTKGVNSPMKNGFLLSSRKTVSIATEQLESTIQHMTTDVNRT